MIRSMSIYMFQSHNTRIWIEWDKEWIPWWWTQSIWWDNSKWWWAEECQWEEPQEDNKIWCLSWDKEEWVIILWPPEEEEETYLQEDLEGSQIINSKDNHNNSHKNLRDQLLKRRNSQMSQKLDKISQISCYLTKINKEPI